VMANRSDREQRQPTERRRRQNLQSCLGLCSRTPSGPAVSQRLHQQAEDMSAPDQHAKTSNQCLQRGSHPDKPLAPCPSIRRMIADSGHVALMLVTKGGLVRV
jgi:hypothetical protein